MSCRRPRGLGRDLRTHTPATKAWSPWPIVRSAGWALPAASGSRLRYRSSPNCPTSFPWAIWIATVSKTGAAFTAPLTARSRSGPGSRVPPWRRSSPRVVRATSRGTGRWSLAARAMWTPMGGRMCMWAHPLITVNGGTNPEIGKRTSTDAPTYSPEKRRPCCTNSPVAKSSGGSDTPWLEGKTSIPTGSTICSWAHRRQPKGAEWFGPIPVATVPCYTGSKARPRAAVSVRRSRSWKISTGMRGQTSP